MPRWSCSVKEPSDFGAIVLRDKFYDQIGHITYCGKR
jgi:hypothetical protein